jgi:hypothetical protein
MVSTLFPPYCQVISKLFLAYFQNLTLSYILPWFSPYFGLISKLFPGYFQLIFKVLLFPYMFRLIFHLISKYVQFAFQLIWPFSIKQPKLAREAADTRYVFWRMETLNIDHSLEEPARLANVAISSSEWPSSFRFSVASGNQANLHWRLFVWGGGSEGVWHLWTSSPIAGVALLLVFRGSFSSLILVFSLNLFFWCTFVNGRGSSLSFLSHMLATRLLWGDDDLRRRPQENETIRWKTSKHDLTCAKTRIVQTDAGRCFMIMW